MRRHADNRFAPIRPRHADGRIDGDRDASDVHGGASARKAEGEVDVRHPLPNTEGR